MRFQLAQAARNIIVGGEHALHAGQRREIRVLKFVRSGYRRFARVGGVPRAEMAARLDVAGWKGVAEADVIGERLLAANRCEFEGMNIELQRATFFAGDFENSVISKDLANVGGRRVVRMLGNRETF